MDVNELAEQIAARHEARSRAESSDPAKREQWINGERAQEQAAEIAAMLVVEAHKALEQKGKHDENSKA